jgi:hypothetical protein
MLEHYYGIQYNNRFDELFGEYFIGKPGNSTRLKNSYHILKFNFSGIRTDNADEIFMHFTTEVRGAVDVFLRIYKLVSETEREEIYSLTDANSILRSALSKIQGSNPEARIYVLIDEYDHFTNELFAFNTNHFMEIVSQNGWVRKFYEVIKQFMGEGIIDRFMVTGVTPVTLDSMTSGFNVAKNITMDEEFHEMAGFTEAEVKNLMEGTFSDEKMYDIDNQISDIRDWYNGSRFAIKTEVRLYNPQMVINFLSYYLRKGNYPAEMYDPSISSDYSKIKMQLKILDEVESNAILNKVIDDEHIQYGVTQQYNFETKQTPKDLVSLLFYNGLLTIGGGEGQLVNYVIPNYVVKIMYWEFLKQSMVEASLSSFRNDEMMEIFDQMRFDGKVDNLVKYISNLMNEISNRDLVQFKELSLKMLFLPVLKYADIYKIYSEPEFSRRYVDLYLKLQPIYKGKYSFILELKYLKQAEQVNYEEIKTEGLEQLTKYTKLVQSKEPNKYLKSYLILYLNNQAEIFEV